MNGSNAAVNYRLWWRWQSQRSTCPRHRHRRCHRRRHHHRRPSSLIVTTFASSAIASRKIHDCIWSTAGTLTTKHFQFISANCACMHRDMHKNWHATDAPSIGTPWQNNRQPGSRQRHWLGLGQWKRRQPHHRHHHHHHRCRHHRIYCSRWTHRPWWQRWSVRVPQPFAKIAISRRPINYQWLNIFAATTVPSKYTIAINATIRITYAIDFNAIDAITPWILWCANFATSKLFTNGIWSGTWNTTATTNVADFNVDDAISPRRRDKVWPHMKQPAISANGSRSRSNRSRPRWRWKSQRSKMKLMVTLMRYVRLTNSSNSLGMHQPMSTRNGPTYFAVKAATSSELFSVFWLTRQSADIDTREILIVCLSFFSLCLFLSSFFSFALSAETRSSATFPMRMWKMRMAPIRQRTRTNWNDIDAATVDNNRIGSMLSRCVPCWNIGPMRVQACFQFKIPFECIHYFAAIFAISAASLSFGASRVEREHSTIQ